MAHRSEASKPQQLTDLVVISGPASSGKMPLARVLMAQEQGLHLIHRDALRAAVVTEMSEDNLTELMGWIARFFLLNQKSVIAVAWNMERSDREMWESIAADLGARLRWFDTRDPQVHKLIPPLAGWYPSRRPGGESEIPQGLP